MKIDVYSNELSEISKAIVTAFSVTIAEPQNDIAISIPENVGEGRIQAYQFYNGLCFLSIKGKFREDFTIRIIGTEVHPLRLIFCSRGAMTHMIDNDMIQYEIKALRNSLSTCKRGHQQSFCFHAGQEQLFHFIKIDRPNFVHRMEKDLASVPYQLKKIFKDLKSENSFLYHHHFSVEIAEVLNQIQNTTYHGLILRTFLESKALELLSLVMSQYSDEFGLKREKVMLWDVDEALLIKARQIVLENLVDPPSIRELARMVGLNEFKLKTGYKQLFHTTIYNQIRQERLNKAKLLLMEGKWDVGEVVRKIGYINKSHFAAKFKEKFGVSPKQFQKKKAG